MITIEMVNKWQDLVKGYNSRTIPYDDMVAKSAKAGLTELVALLTNGHYINKMKDGNVFINWSKNPYYPEATILDLKSELSNNTRAPTTEERIAILEETVEKLTAEINDLKAAVFNTI